MGVTKDNCRWKTIRKWNFYAYSYENFHWVIKSIRGKERIVRVKSCQISELVHIFFVLSLFHIYLRWIKMVNIFADGFAQNVRFTGRAHRILFVLHRHDVRFHVLQQHFFQQFPVFYFIKCHFISPFFCPKCHLPNWTYNFFFAKKIFRYETLYIFNFDNVDLISARANLTIANSFWCEIKKKCTLHKMSGSCIAFVLWATGLLHGSNLSSLKTQRS